MTFDREPTPELAVSRTGGRSAKLVAIGVVVVLASVVYVGISSRGGGPPGPTHELAAAVASAPPSSPASGHTSPVPNSPVPLEPVSEPISVITERHGGVGPYGDLRARLTVNGQIAAAMLDDVSSQHLHAGFRVIVPVDVLYYATLELVEGSNDAATYGSWAVPLSIASGSESVDVDIGALAPVTLLEQDQRPDPTAADDAAILTRNGFRILVTGARLGNAATVNVDLLIANPPTYPDEGYNVIVRAGNRTFRTNQSSLVITPGHMRGVVHMPINLGTRSITIELSAQPTGSQGSVVIASDRFRVPSVPGRSVSSDTTSSGGGDDQRVPQILVNGYSYSLLLTFEGGSRALVWTLDINPTFEIDE
jgi:hypothetical protein